MISWKRVDTFGDTPPPLSGHAQVTLEDGYHVIIFGGIGPGFKRLNTIFKLDTRTFHFSKFEFMIPENLKHSHQMNQSSEKKSKFNLFSKQRKDNFVVAPIPRERAAMCLVHYVGCDKDYSKEDIDDVKKKTIILMGGIGDGKSRLNDVFFLNVETMKWREAKLKPSGTSTLSIPTPRYSHTLAAVNNRTLVMYGGYDGDFLEDMWVLFLDDNDQIVWKEITNSVTKSLSHSKIPKRGTPGQRYHHSCDIVGNKLIFAGGKYGKLQTNEVWMFDYETYKFVLLYPEFSETEYSSDKQNSQEDECISSSDTHISPFHGHRTVVSGKYLFLWGGVEGNLYRHDTYAFDLNSKQWCKIPVKLVCSHGDNEGTPKFQDFAPSGRISFSMTLIENNRSLIFGGIAESKDGLASRENAVWIFDFSEYIKTQSHNLSGSSTEPNIAHEKRIMNFSVDRILGTGGQGTVFLVRDEKGRHLALKRIIVEFQSEGEKRQVSQATPFNEIMLHQKLHHPNVLPIEAFFLEREMNEENIRLNIVMPYCELGDLQKLVSRKRSVWNQLGKINEEDVLDWLIQIAEGLHYIHDLSIIHRDLKPSNVFISKAIRLSSANDEGLKKNAKPLLLLADFGMAKNTSLSLAKTVCGTPAYMSPEVYNSNEVYDVSSDIWSFGVIMFWLVTGQTLDFKLDMNRSKISTVFEDIKLSMKSSYMDIMFQCIEFDPKKRPKAQEILVLLRNLSPSNTETSVDQKFNSTTTNATTNTTNTNTTNTNTTTSTISITSNPELGHSKIDNSCLMKSLQATEGLHNIESSFSDNGNQDSNMNHLTADESISEESNSTSVEKNVEDLKFSEMATTSATTVKQSSYLEKKDKDEKFEYGTVKQWLESIMMEQYLQSFLDKGYDDLSVLVEDGLDDEDLNEIGITKKGHRKKILHKLKTYFQ